MRSGAASGSFPKTARPRGSFRRCRSAKTRRFQASAVCRAAGADILIMDEPTRGIDVGAKTEIYELMNQLAARGAAILMISSELPEVLGMSDRILVMRDGAIVAEFDATDATEERVLSA